MSKNSLSRRRFIQLGTGAVAATTVAKNLLQPNQLYAAPRRVAPSDTIRFASIGTGWRYQLRFEQPRPPQLGIARQLVAHALTQLTRQDN